MSVLVIGKFKGDTAKFQQALADRADEFAKISEASKTVGGLHHRFGIGDGYVLIVDEWESVEQFQKFMSDPDLQAFIGSVGGAPNRPRSSWPRRSARRTSSDPALVVAAAVPPGARRRLRIWSPCGPSAP